MTDLMQTLYNYLQENRARDFLSHKYFWYYSNVLDLLESALMNTLTDEQQELLEQYQDAVYECCDMEQQALFLATLSLARELR